MAWIWIIGGRTVWWETPGSFRLARMLTNFVTEAFNCLTTEWRKILYALRAYTSILHKYGIAKTEHSWLKVDGFTETSVNQPIIISTKENSETLVS